MFSGKIAPNEVYSDFNNHLTNLMWQMQNEPEYMESLIMKAYGNTERKNRIKEFCHRLFVNARDFFTINNVVFCAGNDYAKLFDQVYKILRKAETKREKRHALWLVEKILKKFRQIQSNPEMWDAVLFYLTLKCSFSATEKSWACKSVSADSISTLINHATKRLQNVAIENKDCIELIKINDKETTFFYLDPPYFEAEDYYKDIGEFGIDKHKALHNAILNCKGRCLVSYNDCEFIRQLYSEDQFTIIEFERPHSMALHTGAGKMYKEVLIANYDVKSVYMANDIHLSLFDQDQDHTKRSKPVLWTALLCVVLP